MTLLLRQIVVAFSFASLVYCETLKRDAINFNITSRPDYGSELCPFTDAKISTYVPHPTDCSKFYICEDGIPYLRSCQRGLHFSTHLKACDYPESAGCDKYALKKQKERMVSDDLDSCPEINPRYPALLPHPNDCSKFYICDNGLRYLKKCQSGLHFNPKIKACDYPERAACDAGVTEKPKGRMIDEDLDSCPAVTSGDPVLLPHPEDCNKYYVCDNGHRILKKCPSGLHFNPKIKACDYPGNADCDSDDSEEPKGKMIDDDDLDLCPSVNSEHPVMLPHPEDCNMFYICDSGHRQLEKCQSGLHFNPKIKACDYPKYAGCNSDDSKQPKGKMIDDEDLDLCPSVNSGHPVLLPHPEDCSMFYICDSGHRHLKKCQSGLHFNQKIKACDYPENAGCNSGVTENPKSRIIDDDLNSCPGVNSRYPVFFPHSEDCSKFYICDSGYRHLKKCQSGLHFNPKIKACDYPENAGCNSGESEELKGKMIDNSFYSCPAKNTENPVLLPHPVDCSKFYMCDNGIPNLKKCQPGLHFNPKINACDYPGNVDCHAGMADIMAGEPSPYCPSVNGKTPIFFRHPTNCSVYYMCGNGLAYEFVCPARLQFNIKKRVCDFKSNAKCKNAGS